MSRKELKTQITPLFMKEQNEHLKYNLDRTMLIMSMLVEHKDDKLYDRRKHKDDR